MKQAPAPVPADVALIVSEVWASFVDGVTNRHSVFHTPTVATMAADGSPSLRTVVLRAADPELRLIRFHTDLRSRKVSEIAREPRVSVHVYDPRAKIQVRLSGRAVAKPIGAGGEVAWDASRRKSLFCYGIAPGPGTPIPEGGAYHMPTEEHEIDGGAPNFTAVEVIIDGFEWVFLHVAGHRRAGFTWNGNASGGQWVGTWMVP
jgi:hypothetical protein